LRFLPHRFGPDIRAIASSGEAGSSAEVLLDPDVASATIAAHVRFSEQRARLYLAMEERLL
jgi:hypothetical protein